MALTYDFDICPVSKSTPGTTSAIPQHVALFRDPVTATALSGADFEVRNCFAESGFRFETHDSHAGPGRYPADDAEARQAVVQRLIDNLESLPGGLNWNGFDINAFALAALAAKPVSSPENLRLEEPVSRAPEPALRKDEASSMDDFFSAKPATRAQAKPVAMDDFFSASPMERKPISDPADAPDMDAFFANTAPRRKATQSPEQFSAEDIKLTIDADQPVKRVGLSPVKMGLMVIGLFAVVSLLGSGGGGTKLVELATGGNLVQIGQ